MSREEAIISHQSNSTLPNAFQLQIKQYWEILQEEETNLLRIYTLLVEVYQIWPDQCRQIISFLHKLSGFTQQFYQQLENSYPTSIFTAVSISSHYRLVVMSLQNMNEYIKKLTGLCNQMHMIDQMPLRQRNKHQQNIRQVFGLFIRAYTETLENVPILLDQSRFLERKIR
jgi:hypothetical protein